MFEQCDGYNRTCCVGRIKTCPVCGKAFKVYVRSDEWAYHLEALKTKDMVCSYPCMRESERNPMKYRKGAKATKKSELSGLLENLFNKYPDIPQKWFCDYLCECKGTLDRAINGYAMNEPTYNRIMNKVKTFDHKDFAEWMLTKV